MVSRALHWRHKGEFVCVPSLSGKTTLSYLPFLSYTDIGREDAEELAAAAAPYRYQIRLLAPQQSAFSLSDPVTMRLSLVNRSSNKLWSEALSGKCRNQIRKAKHNKIRIESVVHCDGKTGVEMEALTGVSLAALTIYDMCKAVNKSIVIESIRLEEKKGGKSDYLNSPNSAVN